MSIGIGMCCVDCQTYYATRKTGVFVLETYEDGRPYQVWRADLVECPDCGKQVVTGFGQQSVSTQHESEFDYFLRLVEITINGCPRSLIRKGARPCITE